MNIAVITFSDFNTNYGSILQAYAMKLFLESEGHKITFIRYREFNAPPKRMLYDRFRCQAVKMYYWLHHSRIVQRYSNFQSFIKQNIPHTRLFTSEEDLEANFPRKFDAYICGSDQIWNLPVLGGLRRPYFLAFSPRNKLKIAYAPSMGEYRVEGPEKDEIKRLLRSFDGISTREVKSSKILEDLVGCHVATVVDPTFLVTSKQWLESLPATNVPKGDYAVCYLVRRSKLCNQIVTKLKKIYKIPIYNVSDNLIDVPGTENKYATCGPETFVRLVACAKFCVGTSFHLAAFSTIFNKHCFIAGTTHTKDRVLSIFTLIGRSDHLVYDLSKLDDILKIELLNNIDYKKINKVIEMSKHYLLDLLNDE